jgi:hypothetical protein
VMLGATATEPTDGVGLDAAGAEVGVSTEHAAMDGRRGIPAFQPAQRGLHILLNHTRRRETGG